MIKSLYTIVFVLLSVLCFAGNPVIHGNWKGFLISNSLDENNKDGLRVLLYIIDDNNEGQITGEMTIKYRYQTDIYKAKYAISGSVDYQKYTITLQPDKFIYSDVLPMGLQWCAGGGTINIYRSVYGKKLYMDGYVQSNCGDENMRLILVKQ